MVLVRQRPRGWGAQVPLPPHPVIHLKPSHLSFCSPRWHPLRSCKSICVRLSQKLSHGLVTTNRLSPSAGPGHTVRDPCRHIHPSSTSPVDPDGGGVAFSVSWMGKQGVLSLGTKGSSRADPRRTERLKVSGCPSYPRRIDLPTTDLGGCLPILEVLSIADHPGMVCSHLLLSPQGSELSGWAPSFFGGG